MKKTEASLSWFDKIIYKEKLIYFSRGIRSCYPYILVVYAYQFTQTHTWIGQSWLMVQGVDMVFLLVVLATIFFVCTYIPRLHRAIKVFYSVKKYFRDDTTFSLPIASSQKENLILVDGTTHPPDRVIHDGIHNFRAVTMSELNRLRLDITECSIDNLEDQSFVLFMCDFFPNLEVIFVRRSEKGYSTENILLNDLLQTIPEQTWCCLHTIRGRWSVVAGAKKDYALERYPEQVFPDHIGMPLSVLPSLKTIFSPGKPMLNIITYLKPQGLEPLSSNCLKVFHQHAAHLATEYAEHEPITYYDQVRLKIIPPIAKID